MTPAEFNDQICNGLRSAGPVPYLGVTLPGWHPEANACFENATRWACANLGWATVPGWIVRSSAGDMITLVAHCVVRSPLGHLFDITPFPGESEFVRALRRFVPHGADAEMFARHIAGELWCWSPDEGPSAGSP